MKKPLKWNLTEDIPWRLPVLDAWLERVAQDRPLKGISALMLQHQLGNHVPQTKALLDLGIDPTNLHWIDIPYTSTAAVREALRGLGIPQENFFPGDYQVLEDYVPYQRRRVERFILELAKEPPEHLLVLDDGAYFLDAMARMKTRLPKVSIVEQTTRGVIKIEDDAEIRACAYKVPIINVARSVPKRTLEPPFIGFAVCDALVRSLGSRLSATATEYCLVLGYGSIGQQVAHFVCGVLGFNSAQVRVFDVDPAKRERARKAGFTIWDRDSSIRFKLVLGCSGRASFTVEDRDLLENGAFLASATSGTVELSRQAFIEYADELQDDNVWIDNSCLDLNNVHSDLVFHFGDRTATFINAGFPVNFDGRVNCVPSHYIQPTPTMMCAAAVQAVAARKNYLIELDANFSDWLREAFLKELGAESGLIREN